MFVLTNIANRSYLREMATTERVRKVKRLYPLLYFACHHGHGRSDDLTERDLRILHHIGASGEVFASGLAEHLGLSRSTMSEALSSLERKGLIRRANHGSRRKAITLSESGVDALQSDDGLDGETIGAILDELGEDEQVMIVESFELIARAIERRQS